METVPKATTVQKRATNKKRERDDTQSRFFVFVLLFFSQQTPSLLSLTLAIDVRQQSGQRRQFLDTAPPRCISGVAQ